MKKYLIALVTIFSFSTKLHAQVYEKSDYSWERDAKITELTDEEKKEPAVILKDYQFLEFNYASGKTGIYQTFHRRIRINSDEAIQNLNKVYISMYNVEQLLTVKARTISPKGEEKIMESSAVKDFKDEKGYEYKIFALEGVEKGSEVEYIYTLKKKSALNGSIYFQGKIPVRDCRFQLQAPKNLEFTVKGYNGLTDITETKFDESNVTTAIATNVKGLTEEKYGAYDCNLMRADYYLKYNFAATTNNGVIFSWNILAEGTQKRYGTLTGAEKKAVKKLIKQLKLKDITSEEQKIRTVETYLKENIIINEMRSDEKDNVAAILANKYADESGMLKLYHAVYVTLGIPVEIVYTCDRYDAEFDPDFANFNQLRAAMLYFPNTKKYLSPDLFPFRYGIVPAEYMSNYGIFISCANASYRSQFIEPLPAMKNRDNMDISIKLNDNEDKLLIDYQLILSGYYANNFLYVPLQKEKDRKEMYEEMMKGLISDAEIKKVEMQNTDFTISTADTAYKLFAVFETEKMLARAGNKLLVKIGEAIGPQDQMYQEKERQTDVKNRYNRVFMRTIRFTVPEGYEIRNADDLKMSVVVKDNEGNDSPYGFVSTYKLEGNLLTVNVNEYYNQIDFPKERFEEFRKVVNAAADFNKIILVLEKK